MPVRARSASSISAMRCLPDRLMPRRSSSSASTPSRIAPPSRARAGGSSSERRRAPARRSARSSSSATQAANERRLKLLQQHAQARHGRERLPQRDEVTRACRAERAPGHQPLHVVDGLERVAAALARSVLRKANSSTASSRSWMRSSESSGRSSHDRSSRPPIDVTVRSISCSSEPARPPSAASMTSRFLSVVGSIDERSRRRSR